MKQWKVTYSFKRKNAINREEDSERFYQGYNDSKEEYGKLAWEMFKRDEPTACNISIKIEEVIKEEDK